MSLGREVIGARGNAKCKKRILYKCYRLNQSVVMLFYHGLRRARYHLGDNDSSKNFTVESPM